MDQRAWGIHHKVWHFSRRWELNPDMQQYVLSHGGHREKRQEGMPGNGLGFLAMHRNMIRALRHHFPRYNGLWHGWNQIPTDPDSHEVLRRRCYAFAASSLSNGAFGNASCS